MITGQAVKTKAEELATGATSVGEISRRIAQFVRDGIRYSLDEWDVAAEEVLRKKQGMCAGKALLAAELYRAAGIPARFKVIKILGEEGLFGFLARRLEEQAGAETSQGRLEAALRSIHSLPPQRDHILVQAFLNGEWVDLDLARDRELDYGMGLIGMWRERKVLSEEGPYDSIDGWLRERMLRRSVMEERQTFFQVINQQMEQIRQVGRIGAKAGLRAWTEAEQGESLQGWDIIPGCPALAGMARGRLDELAQNSRAALSRSSGPARGRLEGRLVDWLYALVRHNVKRGRFWELPDVLTRRRADCLGYARLLAFLAADFGLKGGVVEVVEDSRGKYVPHTVCLVNLADGRKRLVDPWYGSAEMRHHSIIARSRPAGRWVIRQLSMDEVESVPEVCGLSSEQLAGISFYILGNSYLSCGMEAEAVGCYHASLWLYPANPRTLFNRAIAMERIHQTEQAQVDYRLAFSLDPSLGRIVATVEELEPLLELDEEAVSDLDQQVYLLRRGFITGQEEEWSSIARRCGIASTEVEERFNAVLKRLSSKTA